MLSCGQTQTLKAIMTVPTTVLGVSFFFPDFKKQLFAHQTIGAVAIVVTINV